MTPLADRITKLRTRIRKACEASGRDPGQIELLPVSKRQSLTLIREAAEQGFGRFGENYVQEGVQKALEAPGLQFVLIGPLQRNKARLALTSFQEIMTLDRPELAVRLRGLAEELDLVRPVWIQVDLWGEPTKLGGCDASGIEAVFQALGGDPRLPVQGFLAIPPPEDAGAFHGMAELREAWQQKRGQRLRLSMGMSADLELALAAGSDQLRIGTAFFGNR
jgi:pyridoxal phosphate enzyme (YggS family)